MICTFKVARVGKIYLFCKPACQKPQILKDFFKTWKMFGIKMLDIQIKCKKTQTIIKRFFFKSSFTKQSGHLMRKCLWVQCFA